MKCPTCSNENPSESKFCNHCGTALSSTPPPPDSERDHANLLQKYIPPELAKKLLSAGQQIESERRLVTVVFADVSGFTAMSEKLDAEDVSTVLNGCFKGLISIVYKYEGVIDKFIGDEIMAIFGAPIAHENDAERAVRCSLEMMEFMERFNQLSPVALPEPLGLHISMNTGMVVAGNVGSDLRMNYSVIGDTVNLASRLKHIAERGEIVLSEDTYRVVSSLVTAEEPQQVEVKGKTEPVKVYKVRSLKGEIEPGTRLTQKSPIIGRDEELALLKSTIDNVVQKTEQRLFIRGEAGVGKTRLKLELVQLSKARNIAVYEGKCSSFEINTPYYLWTTLLKDILQLKPDTGEGETRKRLHDLLQILSMEKHEPYLATLLSLRYEEILLEEDQNRKRKIFESLKELIRALAMRRPSLFLLEDVHWIDRFSQDLLNYLFTEGELAPAMFVPLFRDEYGHSKNLLEHGGTLVDLNRLTKPDAEKLMRARLNTDDIPQNLAELIYKRSEGNPFFIEELVKTILDKGVIRLTKQKLEILKPDLERILPETVQGVIMARIDRLEERLKDVLYGASVIGREFDKQLLKEILRRKDTVDPSLNELLSLELILEKEEAKDLAYLFKHYLIQEVAYNTLLQKRRRELHRLIAQAIEKVFAEKLKEFYELLAFHYEKAEEWEKAATFLSLSGRKVGESFSKAESQSFATRKEAALERLFASEAESSSWAKVLAPATIVLMTILALFFLSTGVYQILYLFGLRIDIMDQITSPERRRNWELGIVGLSMGILVLYAAWKLLKSNAALRRIRVYEVLDEGISFVFKGGERFVVPFADIQTLSYKPPQRPHRWRKDFLTFLREDLLDLKFLAALGILHQPILGGYRLMGSIMPFLDEPGKQGHVIVRRKKGISVMRAQMSLGTDRVRILREVRNLGLSPLLAVEFFDHLKLSFTKWQRAHCPHCAGATPASDLCPTCGYDRNASDGDVRSHSGEPVRVHPARNIIVDALECIVNQWFVVVLFYLVTVVQGLRGQVSLGLVAAFSVGLALAVGYLVLIVIYKRKAEKEMVVELNDRAVTYAEGGVYLSGTTILTQDILGVRRYANLWQRLFGLENIELETRHGLPLSKRMSVYHAVIPNVRGAGDIVNTLVERCRFLRV